MSVATRAAKGFMVFGRGLGSLSKTPLSRAALWFCACNFLAMAVFSQGQQNTWAFTNTTVGSGASVNPEIRISSTMPTIVAGKL